MANIKSSEKSARRDLERRAYNRAVMSSIRTGIKKLEESISQKSFDEIKTSFKEIQSSIWKGVTKGVVKKGTASRKVSRLNAKCKAVILVGK